MVFLLIQSFCRAGALGALLATLSACASVKAQPPSLAEAYVSCLAQARAGTRDQSSHALHMVAACDALAAQAGQPGTAQTLSMAAGTCRTAAGQGYPPGTGPYKRQFRQMHKNRSRAACNALSAAVLAQGQGRQP